MVKWMTIEEISSNVFAGGTPSTKHEEYYDGDIPWIRSGEIDFNVITSAERNITKLGYSNSSAKMIRKGSIVMAMTGATVGKTAVVEIDTSANQSVCAIEINESLAHYKYVYYCLAQDYYKIKASAQGALTSLNLAMIKRIVIPIPSLQEQMRIVRILDLFTASLANSSLQLIERRKQFEYYRNLLLDLSNKEGVEIKLLSEIASTKVGPFGSLLHKKDYINGGVPLVNPVHMNDGKVKPDSSFSVNVDMANKLANYRLQKDDIVFARRGEIGRCAIITENEENFLCGTGSLIVRFKEKEKLNSKFMLYIFLSPFCRRYLEKSAIGGSMLNINCDIVGKMQVPLPSLSEQQRIVDILDTFEKSIVNLEAQLNERQQQYEYYREHLINLLK